MEVSVSYGFIAQISENLAYVSYKKPRALRDSKDVTLKKRGKLAKIYAAKPINCDYA